MGAASPLGPLAGLAGKWTGRGFNVIWRPNHTPSAQDRFLELNVTSEQLEFTPISGPIPNRGLLQPDINMFGLTYLQQISDANLNAGLHIEPGLWVVDPQDHRPQRAPHRGPAGLHPARHHDRGPGHRHPVGRRHRRSRTPASSRSASASRPPTIDFPEQTLTNQTSFRSSGAGLTGVTQAMVNNPNGILQAAIAGQHITATTTLHVTSTDTPVPGGGTANTAFLKGGADGPNAVAVSVNATFWLETLQGQSAPTQLQYAQTVLLNFNTLSWPHITVATLHKS